MRCLTDVDVQTVVDDEATEASRAHVAGCSRCRDRIDERRREMAAVRALVQRQGAGGPGGHGADGDDLPPALEARLRQALAVQRPVRGATALRGPASPATSLAAWRRAGWMSALATAAVVALVVFFVLPRFGAPTSLSASQVLGRSLETLSGARGIEQLEYELVVGGALNESHRIEQLIDHEQPRRFRLATYSAGGVLESAISQDPVSRRRSQLVRVDGRNYIVRLTSVRSPILSLPEMAQAQIEAAVTMMQATSDQKLTIVDSPNGKQYIVEVPPMTLKSGAGMLDLHQARALVDGRDFHLDALDVSGTLLKQPFSVSFKLITQVLRHPADVAPAEFEIQAGPGDVVLEGEASNDPLSDMLTTVLRELGRVKAN